MQDETKYSIAAWSVLFTQLAQASLGPYPWAWGRKEPARRWCPHSPPGTCTNHALNWEVIKVGGHRVASWRKVVTQAETAHTLFMGAKGPGALDRPVWRGVGRRLPGWVWSVVSVGRTKNWLLPEGTETKRSYDIGFLPQGVRETSVQRRGFNREATQPFLANSCLRGRSSIIWYVIVYLNHFLLGGKNKFQIQKSHLHSGHRFCNCSFSYSTNIYWFSIIDVLTRLCSKHEITALTIKTRAEWATCLVWLWSGEWGPVLGSRWIHSWDLGVGFMGVCFKNLSFSMFENFHKFISYLNS